MEKYFIILFRLILHFRYKTYRKMAVIDFMFNISKGAMIDTINNMIYNIALYVFVFIICMWILVCIVRLFVRDYLE